MRSNAILNAALEVILILCASPKNELSEVNRTYIDIGNEQLIKRVCLVILNVFFC